MSQSDADWAASMGITGHGLSDIGKNIPIVRSFYGPPAAPDYSNAADRAHAQSAQDVDRQTTGNRPDQNSPFSTTRWTKNPTTGEWTQNTSLDPGLDAARRGLEGQLSAAWGKSFDDGSSARDQTINAAWGQAQSRLNPMWDQRNQAQQAQLANQGLDPNSQAYRTASEQFGRDRNDAYSGAMNSAIGLGNQAQAQTYNMNMQARLAPLQGLQGLQGLSGQNGFNAAGVAQGPSAFDVAKAQGAYDQGNYQAQQQFDADIIGAGTSMGAKFATSDERLKQNIWSSGVEVAPGVPLSVFEYKNQPGQPYAGVIAQDLEKSMPEHVMTGPDGIKRVSPQFSPTPLPPGGAAGGFLTPEALRQTMALGGMKRDQGRLSHELELAEALKNPAPQHHTTGLGALLAGIGDIYGAYQGKQRADAANAALTSLGTKQDASRLALAQEAVRVQQDEESKRQAGDDEFRKQYIDALRAQGAGSYMGGR